MPPAQQRFDPFDASRVGADLGLVVELEFLQLQRVADAFFYGLDGGGCRGTLAARSESSSS